MNDGNIIHTCCIALTCSPNSFWNTNKV